MAPVDRSERSSRSDRSGRARAGRSIVLAGVLASLSLGAQAPPAAIDWTAVEKETLEHFQTLVRFDTADPPGNEKPLADYLVSVLKREGIDVQTFAREAHRPNVVARLKGNGRRRPLLLMGHTDTVNVDPAKWTHPPFSAARDGGYIYGRGTLDDKDNLVSGLMMMLMLKRQNVPLARDVIFLAESGEEGSTQVGIQFMVERHFDAINAEFCLAEGANVRREGGRVKYAPVQMLEKLPRAIELTSRGVAGHGSVPLKSNAIVHLSAAVARVAEWRTPIRLNDVTEVYFERLATISSGPQAQAYRDVQNPATAARADDYFMENEPRHSSMLRTSISPNMIQGGYRINVIPSEAKASLDVRLLPDEDPAEFLAAVRKVVNDPAITVEWAKRNERPGGASRLGTEAFQAIEAAVKKHYETIAIPTMNTGGTDMAFLRARGIQCYGMGSAVDAEDEPRGFGAHSDQERILEAELYRFVRFQWDVVRQLAAE
jgi:acetylornithine deacetylase/succinyl-diaminopimelate desuccinylase-like protein